MPRSHSKRPKMSRLKRLEQDKMHPKNRKVTTKLVVKEKPKKKITQEEIDKNERQLELMQKKSNTSRTIKHKAYNIEARRLLSKVKKMRVEKQK